MERDDVGSWLISGTYYELRVAVTFVLFREASTQGFDAKVGLSLHLIHH
jgi:hypothetical protein